MALIGTMGAAGIRAFGMLSDISARDYIGVLNSNISNNGRTTVIDAAGNSYVIYTAYQQNIISSTDAFSVLVKYDKNGLILWQKTFTVLGNSKPLILPGPMALDTEQNLFIGVQITSSRTDGFIKINQEGSTILLQRLGEPANTITVSSDAIYTTSNTGIAEFGSVSSFLDFYRRVFGNDSGGGAALGFSITKYSLQGVFQWKRYLSASSIGETLQSPNITNSKVKVDASGNLYIIASILEYSATGKLMLLKFSPSGSLLWCKKFGTTTRGYSLFGAPEEIDFNINNDGSITVVYLNAILTYPIFPLVGMGIDRALSILKFSSSTGDLIAQKSFNTDGNYTFSTFDKYDNIYVGNYFFPSGATRSNLYILKINSNTDVQWRRVVQESSSLTALEHDRKKSLLIHSAKPNVSPQTGYEITYSLKIPDDGSKTGTYSGIVYTTENLPSINSLILPVQSFTPVINNADAYYTSFNSTIVIGNYNFTNSITYI